MLREIKGTQRAPRLLAIKLDGTGTAALNEGANDAALTDTGPGDYLLTFTNPFARAPVVVVTPITAATLVRVVILAASVQVLCFAVDGTTPKDADVEVLVLGWDTPDQY